MLFFNNSNKMNFKNQEARKNRRHKLENTFIINQEGVCQVLDLSTEGLSFRCTENRKFPETLTIDIVNNSGVHIWDLPIKIIWSEKINTHSFSSIHTVKIGAKFLDTLSPENLSALNQLLGLTRKDSSKHHPSSFTQNNLLFKDSRHV